VKGEAHFEKVMSAQVCAPLHEGPALIPQAGEEWKGRRTRRHSCPERVSAVIYGDAAGAKSLERPAALPREDRGGPRGRPRTPVGTATDVN